MKDDKNVERRVFTAEVRADGGDGQIVGLAAVFNAESEDLGGFVEVIEPGAFGPVLNDDVRALFNHDANYVLGRNRSGTLALSESGQGLESRIDPPDTQWANDLLVSMKRGDVDQMSFGFTVAEDDWQKREDGVVQRTIKRFKRLFDVSVVTYPAYPQTSAQARSMAVEIGDGQAAGAPADEDRKPEDRRANLLRKIEIKRKEI
jgi:HK97 family phage prohead protease